MNVTLTVDWLNLSLGLGSMLLQLLIISGTVAVLAYAVGIRGGHDDDGTPR